MSRPISAIGHGALGVRSGLRRFDELAEQTYCERRGYADLLLGKIVDTTWSAGAVVSVPTNYFTTFQQLFDGIPLEVAGVSTSMGESLTRRESDAQTSAEASTFYYQASTGLLYVHLTGELDPSTVQVRVDFLKRVGSVGTAEPLLGVEKLSNADHQTWTSTTVMTGYNKVNEAANGISFRQATVDGRFVAEIMPGASGLAAGTEGGYQQAGHTAVAGHFYWVGGEYETSAQLSADLSARVRVRLSPVGDAILEDGRSQGAVTTGIPVLPTGGERRRFIFPFRNPTATAAMAVGMMLHNSGGGPVTGGYLRVYNLTFKPVYGYLWVDPRLTEGALPTVEVSNETPFMGDEAVGVTGLSLLNSEGGAEEMARGYLETLLGSFDVGGRQLQEYQGGSFDDGQEITGDDWWALFRGKVRDFEVSDTDAQLQLEDARELLHVELPVETLGATASGEMSDRDIGRPLPILVGGPKYNMRSPRVALDPTTRLPIWLVNDPTFGNGTAVMGQVNCYAYTDEDAANRRDVNRRVECEFTTDTTTGRATLASNPGPFEVVGDVTTSELVRDVRMNDALDIVVDGNTRAVFITPGLYTCTTLCAAVEAALDALPDADFSVAYDNNTHQITVSYAGASMTIPLSSGANKHRSLWPTLGFVGSTDSAGLSQTGQALYDETRADQFIVRIDATGYRDHTDGRFTGITGGGDTAIIYKASTILHFLLVKVLGRPSSVVDSASFVAARSSHQQPCVVYLGGLGPSERLTVQEIVDRIEVSCHVDVKEVSGVWYWGPRATSASQLTEQALFAPVLTDVDFLTFKNLKTARDTYAAVSLSFDEDPVTGQTKTREATNAAVPIRHDQRGTKPFDTVLFFASDVQAQAWNQMLVGVLPRRRVAFRVKGRLLRKTVGDLVRIQRTRMFPPELDGMLNEDVFRIMSIKKDPQTHVCDVVAYTADLPRTLDPGAALGDAMLGDERTWKPFPWFVPSHRPVLSPYRPGRIGQT